MKRYISFEKSVGGVVYRQQDNEILYLLLQYRSGQWDFPKGHVEDNEIEQQTLRREINEETGINQIDILPKFKIAVNYFYTAKGNEKKERIRENRGIYIFKKVVYFACEVFSPEVKIDFENKDFVWLNYQQTYNKLNNKGSKKVIDAAQKAILARKNIL